MTAKKKTTTKKKPSLLQSSPNPYTPKLVVGVKVVGKQVVVLTCLHIDDTLRGKGQLYDLDGNFEIVSNDGPSMDDTTVSLPGTDSDKDGQLVSWNFDEENIAEFLRRLEIGVADINQRFSTVSKYESYAAAGVEEYVFS